MRLVELRFVTVALIALLIWACSSGNQDTDVTADSISDVVAHDANLDSNADSDDNVDVTATDSGEDGFDDNSVPQTCEQTLKNWMCGSDGCNDPTSSCAGYESSCAEEPCWGAYCNFVPGNCVYDVKPTVCNTNNSCPAGYSCIVRTLATYGLCVKLPADGLCHTDGDCGANQVCAGEVRCNVASPCLGPEHPGICMDKAAAGVDGGCWDDDMCVNGWCSGATLCRLGDTTCTAAPGACVSGDKPKCEPAPDGPAMECSGSPFGNWCVGTSTESLMWCAPPPASADADGECWDDSECSVENEILCRSSLACPPGSYCRVAGYHSGICGPAPTDGEGIELHFADTGETSVNLTSSTKVILINRGPVAIYFPPCQCAGIISKRDEVWDPSTPIGAFDAPECVNNLPEGTMMRLAPGSGMVLVMTNPGLFNPQLSGRQIKLNLPYWVGCVPAKVSGDKCLDNLNLRKNVESAPIYWPTTNE